MPNWETLEYLGEALVFVGVAGEVYAEWREPERRKLAKASSIMLIIGLALSLAALFGTNQYFNRTIADLNVQAARATERAADADLKRVQLETRIAEIFGPRQLTAAQSAAIVDKLAGLTRVKIDVYVPAIGNPYSPDTATESLDVGLALIHTLRAAHLDAEGWLLRSCANGVQVYNVVVIANGKSNEDRRIASQVLNALRPEIGVYPEVQDQIPACTAFSSLEEDRPNKRPHNAGISIAIGRKMNPVLRREMLDPASMP